MKKGFTLVELLAVIVILSLLASIVGISVTKVLKDSKNDLYNNELRIIEKAAKSWGANHIYLLPKKNKCIFITLGKLKNEGLVDSKVIDPRNNQLLDNNLKVKISNINNNYVYESNPDNVTGCGTGNVCKLDDKNGNGTGDIGEVVTCKTESFYIYNITSTTYKLLSKYNLYVGYNYYGDTYTKLAIENPTGIQDSRAIGVISKGETLQYPAIATIQFGETIDFFSSNVAKYIYEYVTKLNNMGIPTVNMQLGPYSPSGLTMSKSDLTNLGCTETSCAGSGYPWLYSTSYWTYTPNEELIYYVLTNGKISLNAPKYAYNVSLYGVRPTIQLSKTSVDIS